MRHELLPSVPEVGPGDFSSHEERNPPCTLIGSLSSLLEGDRRAIVLQSGFNRDHIEK